MELGIILLLILLGIVLVLAWSLGLGWLWSHLLPFSLLEGFATGHGGVGHCWLCRQPPPG
jgi:hypothetical protein